MTMREILFRGKSKLSGNWCGGYLVETGDHFRISTEQDMISFGVDPDTVGQYTGLIDKNGKKIFEGDIIHFNSKKFHLSGRGVVKYRDGGFAIHDLVRNRWYPFMQDYSYSAGDYRVVGNIYDNPDLMK